MHCGREICRNENDPYAVRSLLGWYVNGPVRHNSSKQVHCNRIQILKTSIDDEAKGYIVGERMIREQLTPQVVSRMFELDFAERKNLKLSDETIYVLGVYFSHDEELATERNFEKLSKLKRC